MNLLSSHRGAERSIALGLALVLVALLAFAGRAQAAETIFWDNYEGAPDSISAANIDGSGGGTLNLAGVELKDPEGMAYDTATNRIYVTNSNGGPGGDGEIVFVNVDGSGAGVFNAPGALVDSPEGVAIDPATRTVYWANNPSGGSSISWARIDGSAGGQINIAGATAESIYRLAIDPVGKRIYWGNNPSGTSSISYANLDNTGAANLDIAGASAPETVTGLSVDPVAGRVYWLDEESERISYANLNGGGGGDISLTGAPFDEPYGLALDPSIGRFYWGNYGQEEETGNAIGFANLAGGFGGITPLTAPVDGPQDPVILKSPSGTGVPTIARNPKAPAELTCSSGGWGPDYAGSFVYQAPRTLAYQWTQNGAAIPGATTPALLATTPGSYACTVTAANHAGSASQGSAPVNVNASTVKLTTKRKAKADPGDLVTFQVKIVNQGDLQSNPARICVKLPNAAKDDLRKPKCKKLGPLSGLAQRSAKFRIKVKPGADEGVDKLTFQVKGTPGKAAKSKIIVR